MSVWNNIKGIFIKDEPDTIAQSFDAPTSDNKKGIVHKLSRSFNYRVKLEMKLWRSAVDEAEDEMRPRRNELYRLYHRALEDDHLLSQVRTAVFTVRSGSFKILKNEAEVKEKKSLFQKPWFRKYLKLAVLTEMWGHSLIEFFPEKEGGEFSQLELIPRLHVRPEYSEIVLNTTDENGFSFKKSPVNKYLIELGDRKDLGLLKVASRTVIRKDYSITDWSQRNERYGMPTLVIKTSSQQKEELDEKQRMAENFGSNGWVILDDNDEVDFKESSQAFSYQTFKDLADRTDKAISILINGQTGTTEEKAHVGSAEVHERILNTYTKDRMQQIQDDINYKLIPFLVRNGYPLEGHFFQFTDLEEKEQKDKPDNMDKGDEQELSLFPQKKKLSLPSENSMTPSCCKHDIVPLTHTVDGFNLDKIMDRAINKVYNKKLASGDIDADTWKYNVASLWQAAQKGSGARLIELQTLDTRYEVLTQLRHNIHVFAAFKNHAQISEMVKALERDGRLLELNEYKAAAVDIAKDYNETWLSAEYNTAVGTAQMAVKWQDIQVNKDVFSHLKYVTQEDDRVRASHAKLHNTTLPVDDPFWDEFFPPNGWGCRCTVKQVISDKDIQPEKLPDTKETPLIFRHNPGRSMEIFPMSHPFFATIPNRNRPTFIKGVAPLVYNNYGEEWRKHMINKDSGGFVIIHKEHPVDMKRVAIAKQLANNGEHIELLSTTGATRNGLVWQLTTVNNDTVDELLSKAKNLAHRVLLSYDSNIDFNTLSVAIIQASEEDESLKVIGINYKGQYVEVSRDEIENRTFNSKIKKALK